MSQVFPKWVNRLPFLAAAAGGPATLLLVGMVWYYGSPEFVEVGYTPIQPVPYSHKLHAGELGIDCRYCHAQVEVSSVATVPPTQTCMGCHQSVLPTSAKLAPIRESFNSNRSMRWVRVHNLPDYVYFDHSIHMTAGVGCVECHGRIDQMEEVRLEKPLSMGWCLDCHRNPDSRLRPPDQVTNMNWRRGGDHAEWAQLTRAERDINPTTDCSGCHR